MWHLYLDESGDLGFDYVNKKPSKFFVITIVAVSSRDANRQLIKAVKKTINRKLNPKGQRSRIVPELKGTNTTLAIKEYFYRQASTIKFGIYPIVLNKRRIYERLIHEKARIYNYIARLVLEKIPFEKADGDVMLIVDKSKGKPEIADFDQYIRRQLEGRLNPKIRFDIRHFDSQQNHGLQVCDLFSWGIFQKHERNKTEWYELFKQHIKLSDDDIYLE